MLCPEMLTVGVENSQSDQVKWSSTFTGQNTLNLARFLLLFPLHARSLPPLYLISIILFSSLLLSCLALASDVLDSWCFLSARQWYSRCCLPETAKTCHQGRMGLNLPGKHFSFSPLLPLFSLSLLVLYPVLFDIWPAWHLIAMLALPMTSWRHNRSQRRWSTCFNR